MARKNFPLRIDPKLYAVLEEWAGDELRSINGHIEFLLRESARKAGRLSKAASKMEENEAIEKTPENQ